MYFLCSGPLIYRFAEISQPMLKSKKLLKTYLSHISCVTYVRILGPATRANRDLTWPITSIPCHEEMSSYLQYHLKRFPCVGCYIIDCQTSQILHKHAPVDEKSQVHPNERQPDHVTCSILVHLIQQDSGMSSPHLGPFDIM